MRRTPAQRRHTARLGTAFLHLKAQASPAPIASPAGAGGSWWAVPSDAEFTAAHRGQLPRLMAPVGKAVYRKVEDEV